MKKILIIDDDQFNRTFAGEALEEAGYAIIYAEDGEKGLEKAGEEHPDLILLDIVMPGLDGIETCRRLKQMDACKRTPIIMYTSLNEEKMIEIALQTGAADYIIKPLNITQLRARVAMNIRLAEALAEIERLREENKGNGELVDLVKNA